MVDRRTLMKAGLGVGALAAVPGLAACSGSSSSSKTSSGSSGSSGNKNVTVGSNYSDAVPKKAFADTLAASGYTTTVNTVDHNTFQEQINSYLQGKPDDVFTWFAGYRMRFFAAQGLVGDISDVWKSIGSNFSSSFKAASTGDDGKQYFVPLYNYPWAIFYRKSLFQEKGYQIPKNLDDLTALAQKMKADGLSPIAFADKDGWPAMGTFDILNMRINGYDFHKDLMAGKKSWTSNEVKKVFDTWKGLLPYHQDGSLGRTWQEAAQTLVKKQSGMYLLGAFVAQQFTDPSDLADLDFFPFPEVASEHGTDSIDAPIDGFMMAKKPKNEDGAKGLLKFLASAKAAETYLKSDPSDVAANKTASTSNYNAIQKKSADLIANSKNIAQFMDRDTRPDFASTVMIPSLQEFIGNPNDIDGLTSNIEKQKQSIFTS
jgi:multiple sugar transport system substrate-binding protein